MIILPFCIIQVYYIDYILLIDSGLCTPGSSRSELKKEIVEMEGLYCLFATASYWLPPCHAPYEHHSRKANPAPPSPYQQLHPIYRLFNIFQTGLIVPHPIRSLRDTSTSHAVPSAKKFEFYFVKMFQVFGHKHHSRCSCETILKV